MLQAGPLFLQASLLGLLLLLSPLLCLSGLCNTVSQEHTQHQTQTNNRKTNKQTVMERERQTTRTHRAFHQLIDRRSFRAPQEAPSASTAAAAAALCLAGQHTKYIQTDRQIQNELSNNTNNGLLISVIPWRESCQPRACAGASAAAFGTRLCPSDADRNKTAGAHK